MEIPTLVGNFEFKTLSRGRELWIEILSQGLGSLTPNFCFWFKLPPYPVPPSPSPPLPHGHNIESRISYVRIKECPFTPKSSNLEV